MERAPAAIIARVMIAAVFFITESSAQKTCRVIMSLCAAWATWSVHEAAARAGTTEVLQKPTKAEGQAKEGDVDGVERGVAAHPFEEDFYIQLQSLPPMQSPSGDASQPTHSNMSMQQSRDCAPLMLCAGVGAPAELALVGREM